MKKPGERFREKITACATALFLVAVILSGCSAREGEPSAFTVADSPPVQENVAAEEPSTSNETVPEPEDTSGELPPELQEWAAGSGWGLTEGMLANHPMPAIDQVEAAYPDSYFITTDRHLYERQVGNSCSAYASAYLLRTLGEDITGQEIYDTIDYKVLDGLVLPQGIVDYFAEAGHPLESRTGSLEQLKARLSAGGKPVILLIGSGLDYQHYITLLGYDEDSLYFFDSDREENPDELYNSILSNEEFLPLWQNIIPGFACVYFVAE